MYSLTCGLFAVAFMVSYSCDFSHLITKAASVHGKKTQIFHTELSLLSKMEKIIICDAKLVK